MLSSRYFEHARGEIVARRAYVGAPPAGVDIGLGGRDEVRAYAERIEHAWTDFWDKDVQPWAKADWVTPSGDVIGDVIGGTPKQKADVALFDKMVKDRKAFEAYREAISGFNPLGPSPTQAWQRLQLFEDDLKNDRMALAASKGAPLLSKDPGELELPGGVDQGASSLFGSVFSLVKWVVVGMGIFYGGRILVEHWPSSHRELPAHEPPPESASSHPTHAEPSAT